MEQYWKPMGSINIPWAEWLTSHPFLGVPCDTIQYIIIMTNYARDLGMTLVLEIHHREVKNKFVKRTLLISHQWLSNFNECNSTFWLHTWMEAIGLCWVDFNYMLSELVGAAVMHESVMMVFAIKLQAGLILSAHALHVKRFLYPKGFWPQYVTLSALLSNATPPMLIKWNSMRRNCKNIVSLPGDDASHFIQWCIDAVCGCEFLLELSTGSRLF